MSAQAQSNPATPTMWWVLGGVAVAGGLYWLFREDEVAVAALGEAPPEEEEEEAPEGVPLPGEPVLPEGGFLPVDPDALTITGNCDAVNVGDTWAANVAFPQIQQQVQQLGNGLVLYPDTLLARAVDRVVRTVLSPYSPCVANMFWRDEWMQSHPFPTIEPVFNTAAALQAIGVWEQERSIAQTQAAGVHMDFHALVQALRKLTTDMYFTNLGVDLAYVPVDTGQAPVMTQSDKTRLLSLGYDLDANVVESFQNHYNLVKNFQTKLEWGIALLNLMENNTMAVETRNATVDAQGMQSRYGESWMGLVETAINA